MNLARIRDQLLDEIDRLSPEQQARLLYLARHIQPAAASLGTPGEVMLADLERYEFAPGALDEMLRVIKEETESIDCDGWQ